MKKKLSLILAILMLVAIATSCGSNSNQPTSQAPPPAAAPPAAAPPAAAPPAGGEQPGGEQPGGFPTGVPTLNADAAKRAEDAYAFIADLKQQASAYDKNAAKYRYTLNCQDPAESAAGEFCFAWSDAVLVATEGAVYIEVGVSNAFCAGGTMEALNDTKAGLIDFVWTLPCYYRGYMPLSLVIQNPSMRIKNSTVGQFAMWELYKDSPVLQAEFANHGETMFLYSNNPSPLSYKGTKELTSTSEIRGNVRGNNGPAQMFITEVGASVFGCPIGDVYPNVSNGVIDFLITDWHAIASFRLADPGVLNYYLDTNIGCSAHLLMGNSDVWAKIVKDGYGDAIKSVSGDFLLNVIGIWEAYEAKGRADAVNNGGTVYLPNANMAAELQTAYDNVAIQWIAENGPEAQAIYDKCLELVNKYNGMY